MNCMYPARLLHPLDFPGKNIVMGCHFLLQGRLPHPGIELGSPTLQADSSLPEPPGKNNSLIVGHFTVIQFFYRLKSTHFCTYFVNMIIALMTYNCLSNQVSKVKLLSRKMMIISCWYKINLSYKHCSYTQIWM